MNEMIINLKEHESKFIKNIEFEEKYEEIIFSLKQKNILIIDEKKKGTQFTTKSYVGRIKIGNIQINISPKIEGEYLYTLMNYLYNLDDLNLSNKSEHNIKNFSILDFLIYEFYREIRKIFKYGLKKSYEEKQEKLQALRGKIDFKKIALNGGIIEDKLPCIYHSHEEDNILNQVVLGGLKYCISIVDDRSLKSKINRLCMELNEGISAIYINNIKIKKALMSLNRLNRFYEKPLMILEMIYNGQNMELDNSKRKINISGFIFDMNRFFERLVGRILEESSPEYTISEQNTIKGIFEYNKDYNPKSRRAPQVRPDFMVLQNNQVIKLIDAKYKDLWKYKIPRDILYQISLYALSNITQNSCTIIYPSEYKSSTTQKLNISNLVSHEHIGEIILKPINLESIAEIISKGNYKLKLKEIAYNLII